MSEPSFSFYDFRKWLDAHQGNNEHKIIPKTCENLIGNIVESRVGQKHLAYKIQKDNPELENVQIIASEFKNDGAKLIAVERDKALIETKSGKCYLPKIYIRL